MERSIIQWNVPNLVSITLMAAVGFVLIGFVKSALRGFGKKSGGNTPNRQASNMS